MEAGGAPDSHPTDTLRVRVLLPADSSRRRSGGGGGLKFACGCGRNREASGPVPEGLHNERVIRHARELATTLIPVEEG